MFKPDQGRWNRVLLIAAGWMLVGLMLALELYFNERAWIHRTGVTGEVDVLGLAWPQFVRTLMWAALAPLILKLREKVPLRSGRWAGGVGFHLTFSFVVMAVYYTGRWLGYFLWIKQAWPPDGFWVELVHGFYGRNLIDMVYYWGVLAFGHTLEIHQRYRHQELRSAQLEARLTELELKTLRQQLHPHFLFNTLNTVAVLVREKRNAEAVGLLSRLGGLLRMALDPARKAEVTLQQEMEFLEAYIGIQRLRFADRLAVHIDITEEARRAQIPSLLLQPIVENAVLHGVAPKAGPGRLEIRGWVRNDVLHLEVSDDGAGLPRSGPDRVREGVGLTNTRDRLVKLYGARSQLTLRSEPGRGVTVQIFLPYRP